MFRPKWNEDDSRILSADNLFPVSQNVAPLSRTPPTVAANNPLPPPFEPSAANPTTAAFVPDATWGTKGKTPGARSTTQIQKTEWKRKEQTLKRYQTRKKSNANLPKSSLVGQRTRSNPETTRQHHLDEEEDADWNDNPENDDDDGGEEKLSTEDEEDEDEDQDEDQDEDEEKDAKEDEKDEKEDEDEENETLTRRTRIREQTQAVEMTSERAEASPKGTSEKKRYHVWTFDTGARCYYPSGIVIDAKTSKAASNRAAKMGAKAFALVLFPDAKQALEKPASELQANVTFLLADKVATKQLATIKDRTFCVSSKQTTSHWKNIRISVADLTRTCLSIYDPLGGLRTSQSVQTPPQPPPATLTSETAPRRTPGEMKRGLKGRAKAKKTVSATKPRAVEMQKKSKTAKTKTTTASLVDEGTKRRKTETPEPAATQATSIASNKKKKGRTRESEKKVAGSTKKETEHPRVPPHETKLAKGRKTTGKNGKAN